MSRQPSLGQILAYN